MMPPANFPQPRLMSSTQIRYQPFSPSAGKSVPSDKQPLPPRTDSIHASHLRAQRQCQRMSRFETILSQGSQVQSRTQHFQPLDPGILSGIRYRLSPNARNPSPAVHNPASPISFSEKVSFAKQNIPPSPSQGSLRGFLFLFPLRTPADTPPEVFPFFCNTAA